MSRSEELAGEKVKTDSLNGKLAPGIYEITDKIGFKLHIVPAIFHLEEEISKGIYEKAMEQAKETDAELYEAELKAFNEYGYRMAPNVALDSGLLLFIMRGFFSSITYSLNHKLPIWGLYKALIQNFGHNELELEKLKEETKQLIEYSESIRKILNEMAVEKAKPNQHDEKTSNESLREKDN